MTTGTEDYAYGNQYVSNMLNKYFTNVGINLAAKISKPVQCNFNITLLIHNNINSIFIQPIAEDEIRMHIRGLDSSKSTGIDGIPIKYIKMAATVITPRLTQLFNICIKKGYFPQALKIAKIVPIFKKGNRENCCNYPPISILSPFAKIFEKCLHEQFNKFFIKNELISSQQYRFQNNCSTSDAVVDIYNNLIKNIENEVITCSIFLDLAKAYDTIDYRILIAKLEKYGVRGVPLHLIESFLTNRQQCTTINSTKSATNKVLCGISQVSTLVPLLFTIYINDLPLASDFKVHLFADDTNLSLTHSQPEMLQQKVNENMQKIINWMRINKLSINYSKSEFMIITEKQFKHKFEIL